MDTQYTNALTPAMLAEMDKSPFTAEQLAEMTGDARAMIEDQEAFCRQHPITAIYRVAVAGSITRLGGVADEFCSDANQGYKLQLASGEWVSVLTEGCTVTYPDGAAARIISSAGSLNTVKDRGVALVGSRLDNGDEIISTPQSGSMLLARSGVPMPEDFLAVRGA